MTHIKDSLHGYIELTEEETRLLDRPEVQRLRRIKQLGLSSLVYPSATHTRLQHSLGVMHLAGRFAESLGVDEQRRKELRTAALLHDTGHGPYSHASELVAEEHGLSHEDFSCEVIEQLEEYYAVDSKRVKKIIKGDLEIGQVVAGDIDADRMDYLMRDAHSSGLEHGHIDADTIIRLAEIDSRRLVFNHKATQALESLFTSRFHMIKTLYAHHTVEIAEKMLQSSMRNYLEQGNSLEDMMRMDDFQVHHKLNNANGVASKLYRKIMRRNLYKRALVWDEDQVPRKVLQTLENRIDNPRVIEKKIAETAGVEKHEVIVNLPKTPDITNLDVKIKKNGDVRAFESFSPLPRALTNAEWRTVSMDVYSPEESNEKVREAAEQILSNYSNALSKYL